MGMDTSVRIAHGMMREQKATALGERLETRTLGTAWNEAYIMLVSCIDYALDMTCIQSVSQCFIVGGIL